MPTGSEPREPPSTRRDPVVDTLHGTDVSDPYRWLEGDGESIREWVESQNEYADAHLDVPVRDALRRELEGVADVGRHGTVKVRGGRYFQVVAAPGDEHGRLVVRDAPDADATILADPGEWSADGNEPSRSLRWFLPGADGERVAYGVTEGGDEQVDIHVVSVPDAERVAVREGCGRVYLGLIGFDAVSPGMVAWDGDGRGLYYVATGDPDTDTQMECELRHWRFDGGEETLLEHDDENVWPTVRTHPESGMLAVGLSEVGGGTDWYVLVDDSLRPVATDVDAETYVVFHGDTAFLRTDHDASRGRLLACSLDRFRAGDLAFADCETVLPEREGLLESFVVTPDHLVAHYRAHGHSRLTVHDHDGERVREFALPEYGSVSQLRAGDGDEVLYAVESFDQPPTVVSATPSNGDHEEVAAVTVDVPDDLVVDQAFVESADGTEVPVFVCRRETVELAGDNPAVLHGYGGFRKTMTPEFDRFRVPFLADGGVYARVCARGGSEYGEAWHEAATLGDKQRTFDDFVAAGEYLCTEGYTNPDRLAVVGRSNGGLSVGAVVTQRPDLWAAAHCAVPLLDMLRFHRFLLGESWTTEYGHPEDSEAFASLREYSPYHNVEPGVEYPPVLFTTGAEDARVHPAHARKMAARLQNEAAGGPFLLRTRTDSGHGSADPASTAVAKAIDRWTFLYDQLGVDAERT